MNLKGRSFLTLKDFTPEEILYLAKPHIGSDNLRDILKRMRAYILARGGAVRFHARFDGLRMREGQIYEALAADGKTGQRLAFPCDALVLAIGHSSRDTFAFLENRAVQITMCIPPASSYSFFAGIMIPCEKRKAAA